MSTPLASILLPAYNERFFAEALASALAQTLADVEIIVSDDSPGEAIASLVHARRDPRIRYERNAPALGFAGNFTRCLTLARGRYVKFLNDDDRLHPRCVEVLAQVLDANPAVTLATSRRRVIDEQGLAAPDVPSTTPISHVSAFLPGIELGDFCLVNGLNLIGEPTTVMFRRESLVVEEGVMFHWGGREYHCLADLSVWLRLRSRGFAYYGAAALSEYRRHPGQEQRRPEVRAACLRERGWILAAARDSGFLRTPELRAGAIAAARAMGEAFHPYADAVPSVGEALADLATALDGFAR